MIFQKEIILPSFPRGFHLITNYIENELPQIRVQVEKKLQ